MYFWRSLGRISRVLVKSDIGRVRCSSSHYPNIKNMDKGRLVWVDLEVKSFNISIYYNAFQHVQCYLNFGFFSTQITASTLKDDRSVKLNVLLLF